MTLTLALRPLGAFIFGRLADRYGRRPVLMVDVALYSLFGFRHRLRAEPDRVPGDPRPVRRGDGRRVGHRRVADDGDDAAAKRAAWSRACCNRVIRPAICWPRSSSALLYARIGWRGMFMVGIVPALLLIFYIRSKVPESPGFDRDAPRAVHHLRSAAPALEAGDLRHRADDGVQLLQPRHPGSLSRPSCRSSTISTTPRSATIAIIYNIGAILGGLTFGTISQRVRPPARDQSSPRCWRSRWPGCGPIRRRAGMLALGAFLMQFFVQGAWGVIPAHLNELSPAEARGTFPGTVYQLGNFIASFECGAADQDRGAARRQLFDGAGRRRGRRGPRDRAAHGAGAAGARRRTGVDAYALTKTSTRSAGPESSAPPMARTSIRSDGTPSSISTWRIASARLSDRRRASELLSPRLPP